MLDTERYYKVLELDSSASPEEIHQGYLDLVWVWHPDRFVGHPRLQKKAQDKLQELNEAHAQLRSVRRSLQMREIRAKSKPQTSPSRHEPFQAESLCKPQGNRTWQSSDQRTIEDARPRVSFKVRDLDAWLD